MQRPFGPTAVPHLRMVASAADQKSNRDGWEAGPNSNGSKKQSSRTSVFGWPGEGKLRDASRRHCVGTRFLAARTNQLLEDGGMVAALIFLVQQWFSRMLRSVVCTASALQLVASGRAQIGGRWVAPHRSRLGIGHRLLSLSPGQLVWMCNTRLVSSWQSAPQAYASWHPARRMWRCRGLEYGSLEHPVQRLAWAAC